MKRCPRLATGDRPWSACGNPFGRLAELCMPTKATTTRTARLCALKEHIEALAAKIESCRKFILVSRIAMAAGGFVLAAMLLGAIRFNPAAMAAAIAALLGGIVVWGSNGSTAKGSGERVSDG